jgi:signal transduction histidine kinase
VTDAVAFAFLLAGSFFALPWTRRRYIHYCFAFVADATYFALGPRAAVLVAGAGAFGALAQVARARWAGLPKTIEARARVTSLLAATGATAVAIGVTHGVRWWLGLRVYPLPFDAPADAAVFLLSLVGLYLVFTTTKEVLHLLVRRFEGVGDDRELAVETSTSLYTLGGIVGAPMQFAAYAVYARGGLGGWACVMLWSVLVNAVIGREVARMRHVGVLMGELAAKERLAAIGEVTARIVHQTRHQLGLIGIIVHRIERRIAGLPEDDAAVVRGELDKLGEVQDELRRMLARDLRGAPESEPALAPRATYASLVRAVVTRLEGLAASRSVRVVVRGLDAADAVAPRDAENVAHALFNVLENAIVAARSEVRVAATTRGAELLVTIADDGPGMSPDAAARALEPFVTTKADGTGMGLPIARAAVGEEGGSLRITNVPEGGLAVDFVFPSQIVT